MGTQELKLEVIRYFREEKLKSNFAQIPKICYLAHIVVLKSKNNWTINNIRQFF